MRDARMLLAVLLAPLLAAAGAAPAAAAGTWTTYLRAEQYTDLLARGDTIWCASSDGGLQRYLRATDEFEFVARVPGELASQALTVLERDRTGRLWIGTEDAGVSRLSADGTRWDLVSTLDGLPSGAVHVLRAVGDTLLIGTEHGIALWNGQEVAGTVPEGVNPSPLPSDVIHGLVLNGDSLWAATGQGLVVSRPSTGLVTWNLADDSFAGMEITALAWDGTTLMAVVLGTPWVLQSGTWTARGGIGVVGQLSDHGGTILACTDEGVYEWMGTYWGYVSGSPVSMDCVPANNPACTGIAAATRDAAGRTWVANRAGLREWDGTEQTLHVPESLPGNNIQNLALQDSRVYVTTFVEGVGRFDGTRWRNWFASGCGEGCDTTFVNSSYAFSLVMDGKGRKWIGCWSSAIERMDDDVSPPEFIHLPPSGTIPVANHTWGWSGAADTKWGGCWIGLDTPNVGADPTPLGLDYYDSTATVLVNYSPENTSNIRSGYVRAVVEDLSHGASGHLWVGFKGNGVVVFNLPSEPGGALELATNGSLDDIGTLDIFGMVLHGDSVFVMSSADLRCFSALTLAQRGAAIALTGSPATRGACHPLDVGPDGTAWVGTDGGVHAYAPGGTVTEYTTANSPLAGNEVRAIRVDPTSGVVWIGTATGLSRFDPFYTPPPEEGLASLEVRVYPNPALLTGAGLFLRLTGNGQSYTGAVYDAGGRRLRRFASANGLVFWDGRDENGSLVRPGIYFVRVESGGLARTVRVALLR